MLRGFVGFGEIAGGAGVNGGGLGIHGERQVTFDAGDGRAHFVAGGRNKFVAGLFFLELFGDVAEGDDFWLGWRSGRGDDKRYGDGFVGDVDDDAEIAGFGILIGLDSDGDRVLLLVGGGSEFVDEADNREVAETKGFVAGKAEESASGGVDEGDIAGGV